MAPDRGGRGYAWLITGALMLMVLSPLLRPASADSFPWSSYPMFGHGLPHARTTVHHLIGFDAAGQRRVVPPALVANDEVLQAEATLARAVRGGRKTSAALCLQVAARVAEDPAWADIVRLELLSERYDALAYFAGDTAPIAPAKARARCRIVRPGDPPPAASQPAKKKKRPKKTRRRPAAPPATPAALNLSPETSTALNLSPETSPTTTPNLSPETSTAAPNLSPRTPPAPARNLSPRTSPAPNLSPGTPPP